MFKLMRWTAFMLPLALGACAQHDNLREWMSAQEQMAKPFVRPLPSMTTFTPFTYDGTGKVEPFSLDKTAVQPGVAQSTLPAGMESWIHHTPEPLEQIPSALAGPGWRDTAIPRNFPFTYIGMIKNRQDVLAMIQAGDHLYPVHVGEFMGENHGKVLSINESSIHLEELIEGSDGTWSTRNVDMTIGQAGGAQSATTMVTPASSAPASSVSTSSAQAPAAISTNPLKK